MTALQHAETDNELIRASVNGSADAFGVLVQRHEAGLKRVISRATGPRLDVDDVAQEVFLKAWVHLKSFRFQSAFRTWLVSIARNHIMGLMRKKSETSTSQLTADHARRMRCNQADPFAYVSARQTSSRLHSVLACLSKEMRAALYLRDIDELNIEDASNLLNVSKPLLKLRHAGGRRKLARLLTGAEVASPRGALQ